MQDPLRDALQRFADGEPVLDDGRVVVRLGLALVFVWFGVDKFVHTSYWPMWVPDALAVLQTTAGLYAIGVSEILLGVLLAAGRWDREVGLATAAYLGLIVASQGWTLVAVRDVGLLAGALYLGLTAKSRFDLDRSPAGASSLRRIFVPRSAVAVVLVVLVVGGGAIAVGWSGVLASESDETRDPLLAFETPRDGATVTAGETPVAVALEPRVHKLGLNHVHVKVDGRVVDALYFQPGDGNVTSTIHLESGQRRIGAYLAYTDHVEYEDSWTAVTVDVT